MHCVGRLRLNLNSDVGDFVVDHFQVGVDAGTESLGLLPELIVR